MARGIAKYGRYDSDPAYVGCPWALTAHRTSESPCIARAGREAMLGDQCVSCAKTVRSLFWDLADDYPPADTALDRLPPDAAGAADLFRDLVRQATAPLAGEGRREDPG